MLPKPRIFSIEKEAHERNPSNKIRKLDSKEGCGKRMNMSDQKQLVAFMFFCKRNKHNLLFSKVRGLDEDTAASATCARSGPAVAARRLPPWRTWGQQDRCC